MKNEKELIAAISELTNEMSSKYPEMSKYLSELPMTNPDEAHPEINAQKLQDYYENLKSTMRRYALDHHPIMPHEDHDEDNKL